MGTVIVGDVFYDDNGNGVRDDNEKSPRYFQLRLFKCVKWWPGLWAQRLILIGWVVFDHGSRLAVLKKSSVMCTRRQAF
jgi:hypothetical protein